MLKPNLTEIRQLHRQALLERVQKEIQREPVFQQYAVHMNNYGSMTREQAIEIALERVEEWDYASDPHGWCHERTVLLTLLHEILKNNVDELLVIFPCAFCRHAHNGKVIFIPSTNEYNVVDLGCHRDVCEYNCKGET